MKATVTCKNCGAKYEYRDEEELTNVSGQVQKLCPFCGSNARV